MLLNEVDLSTECSILKFVPMINRADIKCSKTASIAQDLGWYINPVTDYESDEDKSLLTIFIFFIDDLYVLNRFYLH